MASCLTPMKCRWYLLASKRLLGAWPAVQGSCVFFMLVDGVQSNGERMYSVASSSCMLLKHVVK